VIFEPDTFVDTWPRGGRLTQLPASCTRVHRRHADSQVRGRRMRYHLPRTVNSVGEVVQFEADCLGGCGLFHELSKVVGSGQGLETRWRTSRAAGRSTLALSGVLTPLDAEGGFYASKDTRGSGVDGHPADGVGRHLRFLYADGRTIEKGTSKS